uniref:PD-(D/E)XK nuclease-like domain-containing protein n=1 Tax=Bionectria ochroleuca TaxID=29856 RepID=A0A0B7KAR4_BIOOC
MSSQSVWTWLDSVDSSHACYPDSDDNQFERPCKRQRRQRNHANSTSPLRYLLTPAGSGESVSDSASPKLQPELADLDLPSFFFLDNQDTCRLRFPSRRAIRNIWAQANMHDMESSPEAQWNADVHQPVLDATLKEDGVPVSLLAPHYCVAAPVLVQYRPRDAPSKMVDYCLSIQPCESRHREVIDHIRASRPGCSINHSDQGAQMMKHPIAISIETKRHGEQYDTALLQIATWHSAQWRSLRWGGRDISNIEFLAGLIVQGHDWQFVATAPGDGENGLVRVFRPGIHIGDTRSEEAIYKLLVSLQRLAAWAEDVFWPAFKADFSIPD